MFACWFQSLVADVDSEEPSVVNCWLHRPLRRAQQKFRVHAAWLCSRPRQMQQPMLLRQRLAGPANQSCPVIPMLAAMWLRDSDL